MTSRKKPGVAFWATVAVVVVLVAYPLSFGPAIWTTAHFSICHPFVERAYWPILWTICYGPSSIGNLLLRWGDIGVTSGEFAIFDVDAAQGGLIWFGL